jgi:hypothetical protein
METIKMHWNSVVSTPGAKYCTADISHMYLCSLLPDSEYVRFKYDMIPPNIIEHYSLDKFVVDGFVYAKINKAWYGLKQAGKIAHDDLVEHWICEKKLPMDCSYIRNGISHSPSSLIILAL